ncbi:MAG TPA: 5'/3'-nucleotidase SurE [Anaerolineae bacterium]|nr:5'/3'-nucleotidase SurE [Anaerolineae bacterium]HQH37248.1 5'/3'-nucleotidase SurE [Anaerolineae bacterium]
MTKPLILVTNDDGVDSPGLWAAVEAVAPFGEVLVVAPDRQWSAAGRSMPRHVTGELTEKQHEIYGGQVVHVYSVDATPALCVVHAMMEFAPRQPALLVAGINFGENVSTEVTISGTVGAALEAAAFGVPALAVSLEMTVAEHLTGGEAKDYTAAQHFTAYFARRMLDRALPYDVSVVNVNVPDTATPETSWRLTRLSRQRYFLPLSPDRKNGNGRPTYTVLADPRLAEPDSDVWALRVARVVSVTPLSLDITSRADFGAIEEPLRGEE